MNPDSRLFLHESDKAAMEALQAIPGFAQVMKAFMKAWNEQLFKIENMSTNIKLGENQMSKYYNMLPPICEKLGIEVPELYLSLDVNPNAYTYGDTKPFIVITSGLLELMPDELIPCVLAHECGHIACHHTLYRTMGSFVLNSAYAFVSGLGNIAMYPIQVAFAYWMRCSEFSADRAAAICLGSADKLVETTFRLAGYTKNIQADVSLEAFMEQAEEYKSLIDNNLLNKAMEFMMFQNNSHPLNAVRAYEINEWVKKDIFRDIVDYVNTGSPEAKRKIPVFVNIPKLVGKAASEVQKNLEAMGFENIKTIRNTENKKVKPGNVLSLSINGKTDCGLYKIYDEAVIEYFLPKTDEELALEHPFEIRLPYNYKHFLGKNHEAVYAELQELGFGNITLAHSPMAVPSLTKKGTCVTRILINSKDRFEANQWFNIGSEIYIIYHDYGF